MKLDLKNSKWWKAGFNTSYFQEQLNRFLQDKQAAQAAGSLDPTHLNLNDTSIMMPLGVRGDAKASAVKEVSMLSNLLQPPGKSSEDKDIRIQDQTVDFQ